MTASWRTFGSTIGWGIFCAASWTWCIGMFLPIIMIDRFGWRGFIAFAVPNVLGCAAFGYVVGSRGVSERLVRAHSTAMLAFSVVTIAYHVFFIAMLGWLFLPVDEERFRLAAMIAPPAILSIGVVLSNLPNRFWPLLAVAVFGFSIAVFSVIGIAPLAEVPWDGRVGAINLWWLAPTLFFGFLLCPYLDLTFHRAIQHAPSRHAFSVFGLTFLVMILLTCAYWDMLDEGLRWIVAAHIVTQACFTVAAHVREVRMGTSGDRGEGTVKVNESSSPPPHPIATSFRSWVFLLLLTLLALPLAMVGEFIGQPRETALDIYVRFLVFYGLLFPMYVLLIMARRAGSAIAWGRIVAVIVFIIVASILYELGFIHHQYALLPIPLAAVLLWWGYLVLDRRPVVSGRLSRTESQPRPRGRE